MSAESLPSSMTGRVAIDLAVHDDAWLEDLPDTVATVERSALAALDHACPGSPLVMAVILTDDAEVRTLNGQWRKIDKPTNVLSFPTEERVAGSPPSPPPGAPPGMEIELGDIVLARETVLREACEGGLSPYHHLCHLVVHGSLHLLGYDHEEEDEAERMERLEAAVLSGLGIADPYV